MSTGLGVAPGYAGTVAAHPTGSRRADQPLDVRRWALGCRLVPYHQAWAEQRRLHEQRVTGEGSDTVLLLEHEPVYTAGKRTQPAERPVVRGSGFACAKAVHSAAYKGARLVSQSQYAYGVATVGRNLCGVRRWLNKGRQQQRGR